MEMLHSSLEPLTILIKLVQSKFSLISAYGPTLWAVKSHVQYIWSKVEYTDRSFDVSVPLKKVDKYLDVIKYKYPIFGLAACFHYGGHSILDGMNVDVTKELMDLSM